jgi:drug/metabolite transporter (DMT)-like permease
MQPARAPDPALPRNLAAAVSMLAGMAVIGCIDNLIAPMSQEIGLWQFMAMRAVLAVPLVVAAALVSGAALRPRRLWAVALRAALVAGAMLFYFGALAFVPIAQALAGLFTAPIFVLLISVLALRQRVGPWRVAAVALGFTGILLIIAPWQAGLALVAMLPMLGGLLYALGSIATRTICAGETVLSMLFVLFVFQGLIGVTALSVLGAAPGDFITRGWVWPLSAEVLWIVLVQAVGSVLGVGLLIRGYALGETSYVAPFEYSVFLFGSIFAYLFFGQVPTPLAALGVCLIVAAGINIALRSDPPRPRLARGAAR